MFAICSIPNQLNPALNGKRADPSRDRPLTMVAGAGFALCIVESNKPQRTLVRGAARFLIS